MKHKTRQTRVDLPVGDGRRLIATILTPYSIDTDGDYTATGRLVPLLLTGRGNPKKAIDDAVCLTFDYLLSLGLDKARAYLDHRGIQYALEEAV